MNNYNTYEILVSIIKKDNVDLMDRIHFSSQVFGFAFYIDSFDTPEAWESERDEVFEVLRLCSEMIDRVWYMYEYQRDNATRYRMLYNRMYMREQELEKEVEKLRSELEFIKDNEGADLSV